jgi:PAS domain S-box-containing protein
MDISLANTKKQTAPTTRHESSAEIVVSSLVVVIYGFASDFNIVGTGLLLGWALFFFAVRSEIKHSRFYSYVSVANFSLMAITVSQLSGISAILVIIPVLILTVQFDRIDSMIISATGSIVFAFFFNVTASDEMWLLFGGTAITCWMVGNNIRFRLSDTQGVDYRLRELEAKSEKHLAFVRKISAGEFETINRFQKDDGLGQCLHEMAVVLQKAKEEEKIRSWQMNGVNQLGTILRSSADISANYQKVLSYIINYLSGNQGGLFVIEKDAEDKAYLDMKTCYAYERHKQIKKQLDINEGLIGQCVLEKDTIYLEEIPENYVHITSGLGLATPRSIVIAPLKNAEEVVGVIEVACFKTLQKHEREFLNQAAEIIGAAILSFQRSAYTTKMLDESRQLAEDLRSQQEEVRQNLEELEATQEHLTREGKEREKLQLELNKSKEFLNLVVDSVPIPVFVKDREHRMVLLNKAVCDLNNMTKEQMLGKSDYDFFTKDEADVFWRFEEEIFVGKKGAEKVEHAVRNGRETYTIDKKLVVETDDGDNFLVGINIDVTYAKMMEMQLQNEARMLVRTREDLRRFADLVVKEVKAPLEEINGLTAKVHQDFNHVHGQYDNGLFLTVQKKIQRMNDVIDVLSQYLGYGREKHDVRIFNTYAVVQDVIKMTKHGPYFSFEVDQALPMIKFDRNQLHYILSVLIKNAIQHHDKETGKVIIRYNNSDKLHQFSVHDDGPGINPSIQENIFDVFDSLKVVNEKFTIGNSLILSKKIIEENGGSLWIESNGLRGSKFVFNLPK